MKFKNLAGIFLAVAALFAPTILVVLVWVEKLRIFPAFLILVGLSMIIAMTSSWPAWRNLIYGTSAAVFIACTIYVMFIFKPDIKAGNVKYEQQVATPKTTPLTHIFKEEDGWVVMTDFEMVDAGTQSTFVAQAHRPHERDDINRLVFMNVDGYFNGAEIPHIGDKIKVLALDVRMRYDGSVTFGPNSVMFWVMQPCRH